MLAAGHDSYLHEHVFPVGVILCIQMWYYRVCVCVCVCVSLFVCVCVCVCQKLSILFLLMYPHNEPWETKCVTAHQGQGPCKCQVNQHISQTLILKMCFVYTCMILF